MAAPTKVRLKDEHLRRWLAGDVSIRGLARELGVSDTAIRNRLKTAAIAKRLLALEQGTEKLTVTPRRKGPGKPSSSKTPSPAPAQSEPPELVRTEIRTGRHSHTSFESTGAGAGMRVGFGRSAADATAYTSWLDRVKVVRADPLPRHPVTGTAYDPDDPADVARVERLAEVLQP